MVVQPLYCVRVVFFVSFFFFKQKRAYEFRFSLVGSEMCIEDRTRRMSNIAIADRVGRPFGVGRTNLFERDQSQRWWVAVPWMASVCGGVGISQVATSHAAVTRARLHVRSTEMLFSACLLYPTDPAEE